MGVKCVYMPTKADVPISQMTMAAYYQHQSQVGFNQAHPAESLFQLGATPLDIPIKVLVACVHCTYKH